MEERPTGTWLSGAKGGDPGSWPGRSLGLPPEGPGSLGSTGARLGGFVVDLVIAGLIAPLLAIVAGGNTPEARQVGGVVVFLLMHALLLPTAGATIGMRLAGIRVQRLSGRNLNVGQALLRGLITVLVVPALIPGRDGRCLHDKAVGSVVLKA